MRVATHTHRGKRSCYTSLTGINMFPLFGAPTLMAPSDNRHAVKLQTHTQNDGGRHRGNISCSEDRTAGF